jgi:hypothetical protein
MLTRLAGKIDRRDRVMILALVVAVLVLSLSAMAASPAVAGGVRNAALTTPGKSAPAIAKLEQGRTAYPGTQLPCSCLVVK